MPSTRTDGVDLYWVPLGAGEPVPITRWSGILFERVAARREHRRPAALFHSALKVVVDDREVSVEMAPAWGNSAADRGVIVTGPVGLRVLGRSRYFRYEVRRWTGGTIPDLAYAVDGPVRVTDDPTQAARLLDLVPHCPAPTWGRDELGTGDMWNSNSVTAWLLTASGIDVVPLSPPAGGRAPGWSAGVTVARRPSAPSASH